jgi:hypothetical protein
MDQSTSTINSNYVLNIVTDSVATQTWQQLIQGEATISSPGSQLPAAASTTPMGGYTLEVGKPFQSPNFVEGAIGWRLQSNGDFEANDGTFRGALIAGSIDIPNTTTANSFHVDTAGNAWWGATTLGSAIASISYAGVGTFTNIVITGAASTFNGSLISNVQNRAEATYTKFRFLGSNVDGLTALTTNSTITRNIDSSVFTLGAPAGVMRLSGTMAEYNLGNNVEFTTKASFSNVGGSNVTVFMGVSSAQIIVGDFSSTSIVNHMGFFIDAGGTLSASNADGSTQKKTAIVGVTLSSLNTYRIVKTAGAVGFYVNDVLQVTHVVNTPTTGGIISFGADNGTTNAQTCDFKLINNYTLIIS